MLIYAGNTSVVELMGVQDAVTGEYVTSGTPKVTDIRDVNGSSISASFPISGSVDDETQGRFYVVLPADLGLAEGETYFMDINLAAGGSTLYMTRRVEARRRS